ncbi:MAG: hypothetical protein BGO26_16545 [Actinobacteria bacterium 69-20]|nr:type II secretion system F family protein [Actinomycetota bacterium]OJV27887.1 MAG: hypothetical protein BGO26_16545 [Actinobacteria bacterium 69-20]
MTVLPVLIAVAVAVAIAGIMMAAAGIYGTDASRAPAIRHRRRVAAILRESNARTWTVAAAGGFVVWTLSGWPVAGIATVIAIPGLPKIFGAGRQAAARIAMLQGLEEWVRRLSDAIAAGAGPTQTIAASAAHAPAAIKTAVTRLAAALSAGRADTSAALDRFAAEVDDPLGDMVAIALKITITAPSAKVPDVLRTLAAQLADDVKARREIETDRAEPRSEARMIIAIQIVFAVAIVMFTSYADTYASFSGQLVLAAIVTVATGALIMLRRLAADGPQARLLVHSSDHPGRAPVMKRSRRVRAGVAP